MVEKVENFFTAIHLIILSFFERIMVFAPALVNAVLLGFAVHNFCVTTFGWRWEFAAISGVAVAGAMESAGVNLSRSMEPGKVVWKWVSLYVGGSWFLVILGLNHGFLVSLVGIVMPIFAVAVQWNVSQKDFKIAEQKRLKEEGDKEIIRTKEQTKQERAKARAAKAGGIGISSGKVENIPGISTPPPVEQIMEEYGVGKSRAYEIRKSYTNGHHK